MLGIKELLSKALNSNDLGEINNHLTAIKATLDSSEKLDLSGILPSLQKIEKTQSVNVSLALSQVYTGLLSRLSQFSQTDQVLLIQNAFGLCQSTLGSYTADELLLTCSNLIKDSPALSTVKDLKKIIDLPEYIDNKLTQIATGINQGGLVDLSLLIELLSECSSIRLQYQIIEERLEEFLASISEKINEKIILGLIKILENFVFPREYLLTLREGHHKSFELKNPKFSTKILKVVLKTFELLSAFNVSIGIQTLSLLHRLWDEPSVENEILFDPTKNLLDKISAEVAEEHKAQASSLLYKIMNKDIEMSFKIDLETSQNLRSLFDSADYKPISLYPSLPEKVFDMIGYALNADIPASENFNYYITVETAESILVWGFVCLYYDIGIRLTRVTDSCVLIPENRVKCDTVPATGSIVLSQPGLYQLTWVNSYSWLHSKHIRYRVTLFSPLTSEKQVKKQEIQVINFSANPLLINIGVWKKSRIQVLTHGSVIEIPLIQAIYDTLKLYPEGSQFAVGVVGAGPLYIPKLNVAGLCSCVDSDALTLLGFEMHGPHTVIAAVQEEGLRVTVGVDRAIVYSGNSEKSLPEEIAELLNVFGPAFVFVAGEGVNVKTVEKEVEMLASTETVQQSFFRLSNDLLLEAASKLFGYYKDLYKDS